MAVLTKKAEGGAHWYTADGQPCHDQRTRDGSGTRKTTIRDAQRLGLLPSVTSILGVIAKPGLETWKLKKVAEAALANPKTEAESADYWVARVVEASKAETAAAADLGSAIHDALDAAVAGDAYAAELTPYVTQVLAWVRDVGITITEREIVLTNAAEGYAGRVDALFTYGQRGIGILDHKTRKTEPGKLVTPYDGQGMQLAAYAAAYYGVDALPRVLAANVFISTTEPGRMEVCKHEHLDELYQDFLAACRLWRASKGWDPRQRPAAAA
jgi:hypothetical protein